LGELVTPIAAFFRHEPGASFRAGRVHAPFQQHEDMEARQCFALTVEGLPAPIEFFAA
jgi:hypothetical protein